MLRIAFIFLFGSAKLEAVLPNEFRDSKEIR